MIDGLFLGGMRGSLAVGARSGLRVYFKLGLEKVSDIFFTFCAVKLV